jgi:hypothetical protein
MSNLVKLYTIQFIIISNGTYFQMISHDNYHQIELNEFLQFKFKLLSANSAYSDQVEIFDRKNMVKFYWTVPLSIK